MIYSYRGCHGPARQPSPLWAQLSDGHSTPGPKNDMVGGGAIGGAKSEGSKAQYYSSTEGQEPVRSGLIQITFNRTRTIDRLDGLANHLGLPQRSALNSCAWRWAMCSPPSSARSPPEAAPAYRWSTPLARTETGHTLEQPGRTAPCLRVIASNDSLSTTPPAHEQNVGTKYSSWAGQP